MTGVAPAAPRDESELLARARALAGRSVGELARALGLPLTGDGVHTKGKVGTLVEAALGATGGSRAVHDFPELGVELKTVPVDVAGRPRESTFVCALPLDGLEHATWPTSWARKKLARVLWVPIVTPSLHDAFAERTLLAPVLWAPTREQEEVLASDFDEIVGTIAIGGIEGLTARTGRWLQLRPKAADGTPRAIAYGSDGEAIPTVARGFYLRSRFTGAILADPTATP